MENTSLQTQTAAMNIEPEKMRAMELHANIKASISTIGAELVQLCKNLKAVRDEKTYEFFGYKSLKEYTMQEFNFGERQAYNYIRVYENLGEPTLRDNAELGITKLLALVSVPALEREEFLEDHDVKNISSAEFERLVEENSKKGEQLTMLTDQLADKDTLIIDKTKDLTAAQQKINELTAQLEAERNKPVEAAVYEPDEETLAKIRQEEQEKYEKTLAAEKKKLKKEMQAEAKEKNKALEDKNTALENEKRSAEKQLEEQKVQFESRIAELEKENSVSRKAAAATDEVSRFKVYFEEMQKTYNALIGCLEKITDENEETGMKYNTAVKKFLGMMLDKLEG